MKQKKNKPIKTWGCSSLFFFPLFFLCFFPSFSASGGESALQSQENSILLDRIAAVVNDEIITLTDIDKAMQFYPSFRKTKELEDQFYSNVLEDLINYKVVFLEYKNNYEVKEEDFVQIQTEVIDKLGSLDLFKRHLKSFNMEWQDFKAFVLEKVIYEKVLTEHLQVSISVSFKEIETFYREEYVPQQDQLGLTPKTLIEMAAQIENHLRKIHTQEKLSDWLTELRSSYHIENKLSQEQTDSITNNNK